MPYYTQIPRRPSRGLSSSTAQQTLLTLQASLALLAEHPSIPVFTEQQLCARKRSTQRGHLERQGPVPARELLVASQATGEETCNITGGKNVPRDRTRMLGSHRGGAQRQLRRGWEGRVGLGRSFPEAFELEGVNQTEGILSFPKDPSPALSDNSL